MVFAKRHTGVERKENSAINGIPSSLAQSERRMLELQRMLHNISEVHSGSIDSNLKFSFGEQRLSVSEVLSEFVGPLADTDKIDAAAKHIAAVNLSMYLNVLDNRENPNPLLAKMADNNRRAESRFINDKELKESGENKVMRERLSRFRKLEKMIGEDLPNAHALTIGAPTGKRLKAEENLVNLLKEMALKDDFREMYKALIDLAASHETLSVASAAVKKMSARGEGIEAAKTMLRSYISAQRDNVASISSPTQARQDPPTLEMPKVTTDTPQAAVLSAATPAEAAVLSESKKEYHETINELFSGVAKNVKDLEDKLKAGISIHDPGVADSIRKANESNLLLFAVVHTFMDRFKDTLPKDEIGAIEDMLLNSNQHFHNLSNSTGGMVKVNIINIGNAIRSHNNELHEKLMELHGTHGQIGTQAGDAFESRKELLAFINGEYRSKYPELMQELGRLGVDTESFMGEYVRHVFDISASLRSATRKAEGAQEEGTSHEESPAIFSP